MARIKEEDLRLNIIVNGDKGRKEILDLEDATNRLKMSGLKLMDQKLQMIMQGKMQTEEYRRLSVALQKNNDELMKNRERLDALRRQQSLNTMTISELRMHIRATSAVLSKAIPGTEQWARLNKELADSKSRLAELNSQSKATGSVLQRMSNYMNENFGALTVGYSLYKRFSGSIKQATDAYLGYDEALTDAMKTTNLSKEEITELSGELAKIDTRTPQNELLALVRAGGKLGIEGRDNLLGFVRAADQINVALSEDLGGNAEAAITAIGKMTDIFRLQDMYGVEDAMLKVGSAVNELGMASTANEGYMVDFTQRMAGIAPNADISIDKILGLAATLDKYGQTAEMSSTAIGQMIQAMFRDTGTFAELAGMSLKDFSELLDKDVNEVMLRVFSNMRQGGDGLGPIVEAMDKMGLNGQRASQVLGTLADHVDELRVQQELANRAFAEGTSLTEEFAVKNTSATAELEKQQKAIQEEVRAIGQELMPVVNGVMDLTDLGLSLLAKLVSLLMKAKGAIIALTAAVIAYNVTKKLQAFWSKENRAAMAAEVTAMGQARAGTLALAAVQNLLAGNLKAATMAIKMMGKALLANPVGLIVSGIAAAVSVFAGVLSRQAEKTKEVTGALDELNERTSDSISNYTEAKTKIDAERTSLEKLKTTVLNAAEGSDERAEAIKAINEQYGDYLPNLLTEKSSNEDVVAALRNVNTQLERKILLQARESAETEVLRQKTDAVKAAVEGLNNLSKQKTGTAMTAEEITTATEALMAYYDALQEDPFADGAQAGVGFMDTMKSLGLVSNTSTANRRFLKLSDAFREAAANGRKLRAVTDSLYGSLSDEPQTGNPDPDGIVPAGTIVSGGGTETKTTTKWSLSSDIAYQEQLLALKKTYLAGEIATEKEYNEQVKQLEIDTIRKRLENVEMSNEERVSLEGQLQDRLIDRKEAASDEAEKLAEKEKKLSEDGLKVIREVENDKLAEEERRYEVQKQKFAGNAAVLEALERQHMAKMSQIRLDALNDQIAQVDREHKLERTAMLNSQTEELASFNGSRREMKALKQRQYEELAALDLEYAQKLKCILDAVVQFDGTVSIDFEGLSVEELTQLQQKLQDIIYKVNELQGKPVAGKDPGGKSSGNADGAGEKESGRGGSLFGVGQEQWTQFFDNLAQGKLGAQELQTILQGVGGMAQEAFKLASMWSEKQTALENQQLKAYEKANDKKKQALQDRVDAGLMTEAQYNAEVERMDAEYDAYQEELQLKQAKRNKQMQLTQAIINTALGVTMTLAQWGIPWGLIPAGIMAAMGAAEIALISSTPITTGYAKGGLVGPDGKPIDVTRSQDGKRFKARLSPEKRGFISSPTVLVSENGQEYVIPAEGLDNPTLLPFINTLETARRNGRLKDLNFESVFPPVQGRASGGYVSGDSTDQTGAASSAVITGVSGADPELKQAIIKLLKRLDTPIEAKVSMLGRNGIVEQTERYNRMRNRGRL